MNIELNANNNTFNTQISCAKKQNISDTIKKVALDNLKVLAVTLILTSITIPFLVGPTALATLLVINISLVAFSFFFQLVNVTRGHLESERSTFNKIEKSVPAGIFSLIDMNTRDVLVHEAGHAWMANKVYKNARPIIEIYPWEGGQTSYYPQKLTSWGKSLGARKCRVLVAAAGPAAAILWHCGGLIAAHKLDKSHPEVSRYIRACAITSIFNHTYYALSALWASSKDLGHDFVALWRGGIHPLASASAIIALPLIVQAGLILSSKISVFNQFGYK